MNISTLPDNLILSGDDLKIHAEEFVNDLMAEMPEDATPIEEAAHLLNTSRVLFFAGNILATMLAEKEEKVTQH